MHRFCVIILVVVVSQAVVCSLLPAVRDVPETNEVQDLTENQQTTLADKASCVPLREPCTFHDECCSKACLGFMRWCVTGPHLGTGEE